MGARGTSPVFRRLELSVHKVEVDFRHQCPVIYSILLKFGEPTDWWTRGDVGRVEGMKALPLSHASPSTCLPSGCSQVESFYNKLVI